MILVKTEMGQRVFKDRSLRISPRQRSAFILFDGKRSVDDVLQAGMGIAADDIDQMIEIGMLSPLGDEVRGAGGNMGARDGMPVAAGADATGVQWEEAAGAPAQPPAQPPAQSGASGRSSQQRYKDAYPIATRLSGSLGLRGFRLNLAVEGTSTYEELLALAPRIRAAVGPDKAAELDRALND